MVPVPSFVSAIKLCKSYCFFSVRGSLSVVCEGKVQFTG
jgi:hypothetical protein